MKLDEDNSSKFIKLGLAIFLFIAIVVLIYSFIMLIIITSRY